VRLLITGRKGDMQINPDGTKTMETGSEKMIYQWNDDLNIVTQQTEESKRRVDLHIAFSAGYFGSF
jgi:hypothetical protein